MKKLTAATVVVGLTVACGDELGGILGEIEEIYDRAELLLEQQVADAPAEIAAAEEVVVGAEADLAAAEAAWRSVPKSPPPPTVREVLDREFMERSMEEAMARSEEVRRLQGVATAARAAVAAAEGARRAAERRRDAAERTIAEHERRLQTLREAYEDDTWDLLTLGQEVSPRSILIDARREAEAELARVEAGRPPSIWP